MPILRVEFGWALLTGTVSNEDREKYQMRFVQGEKLVPGWGAAPASDLRLFPLPADRHDGIEFSVNFQSAIEAIDSG